MSSTILYLAIVAIWAGVLVPRWLRREPHREAARRSLRAATTAAHSAGADAGVAAGGAAAVSALEAFGVADLRGADRARKVLPPRRGAGENAGRRQGTRGAGRARAMAARRRLFGILVLLAGAAATIAATGLATWWVAAPPAGMFAGYLLLLREAARADAERAHAEVADVGADVARAGSGDAELEEKRGTAVRASSRVRQRSATMTQTAVGPVSGPLAAMAAADTAAAGDAVADLEGTGTADVVDITARVDEELYDQYADAKLRAVGD